MRLRRSILGSTLAGAVTWGVMAWVGWVGGATLAAAQGAAQDSVPEVVLELLQKAEQHRAAGRLDQAIAGYQEALRLEPSLATAHLSLGALYNQRGDFALAYAEFTAGLQLAPKDRALLYDLLYNAAVLALRLDQPATALELVDRALVASPREAQLLALQSAVLHRLERPEEALAALTAAVKLDPGDAQLHFRLGNLYHELGRKPEAIRAFEQAIARDKNLTRAYYNLGAVLHEVGQDEQALEAYAVALQPVDEALAAGQAIPPEYALAYLNLGAIHARRQDWPQALRAYETALKIHPGQPTAQYNRGYVLFQLGRLSEARVAYEQALAQDPELPLAYLHLGQILKQQGDSAAAVRWLEQGKPKLAAASANVRATVERELGDAYSALGQVQAAEGAYRAALAVAPEDVTVLLSLGRLLRRQGQVPAARELLAAAQRLAPAHLGVALELAQLAKLGGDLRAEREVYEEILAAFAKAKKPTPPALLPVQLNLALVLLQQGEHRAARRLIEPLVASSRRGSQEHQLLSTALGLLLAAEGALQEARQQLRTVTAADPGQTAAREALTVLGLWAGDVGPAAQALAHALPEHQGSATELAIRANLGQALWLLGRPEEARAHLEAAAAAFPTLSSVQAALGEIALQSRDFSQALAHLNQAAARCGPVKAESAQPGGAAQPMALGPSDERVFALILDGGQGAALCQRVQQLLAVAHLGSALAALERGASEQARDHAERALGLPLDAKSRAIGWLLRGTALLLLGADRAAKGDLEKVSGSGQPGLVAIAANNLGVAHYRLGEYQDAERAFTQARAAQQSFPEATLNLGILFDEVGGNAEQALALYREYLGTAGGRRAEVEDWVARLRKFHPQ